jgi:hypothetical protein
MTYDEYQNKRSWLIDTAETPADQKRLKAQLAALEAKYKAQKTATKPKVKAKTADDARKQATDRAQMLRGESENDKAYRLLMESVNYDVSKIPGFRGGRGTR